MKKKFQKLHLRVQIYLLKKVGYIDNEFAKTLLSLGNDIIDADKD